MRRGGAQAALVAGLCLGIAGAAGLVAPRLALAQGRAGAETEEERVFQDAEALFNAGRYADAAPLYDRALALNSTRPATFVKRATLHFRDREYQKAIDLLTRAERLAPEDLNLKTVLGLCLYQSGRQREGLRYLQDVTARRPETVEAQLQIGQHYASTDPDRAIPALEAYLRYRPDEQRAVDGLAQLHLGTAYYLKGRLVQAEQALEAAHKARPRDIQTQLTLGAVVLSRGDFARAAALHEPLQDEIPRRPRIAFNLATAYLKLGRKAEARRLALVYAGKHPDDPRGQMLLGDIALSGSGPDPRLALRLFERAEVLLQKAPSEVLGILVRVRMARMHLLNREPDTAVFLLDTERTQLLGRHPESEPGRPAAINSAEAELLAVLIESYLQLPGQASEKLPAPLGDRLAALSPGDAAALSLAGSAALSLGNLERARRLYQEALALGERSPGARGQPRARAGLSRVLQRQALVLLGPGERPETQALQAAVPLLEQAQQYDDTPGAARNLAAVYLMQGRPADAERILGRLLRGGRDVAALRLHARALLLLGSAPERLAALKVYEQAMSEAEEKLRAAALAERPAASELLAGVLVELGGRYLEVGRLDDAIVTLERAVGECDPRDDTGLRRAAQRDLELSFLQRGLTRLRDHEAQIGAADGGKLADAALEDLLRAIPDSKEGARRGLLERKELVAALCGGALAAVHAAKYGLGRELLGRAQDQGGCELVPPYERAGNDLLRAYVSYRDPTSPTEREAAWKSFPKLVARLGAAQAPVQTLLRALWRSTGELLAYDYFTLGRLPRAAQLLQGAQKLPAPAGASSSDDILTHNRAVLELSQGRGSEKLLERLAAAGTPAEAVLNLGILYDRRGDSRKALELYRRALLLGQRGRQREWMVRAREWVATKERFLGGAP